uniref:histidine kinase n=1 Tax=candidate division WOR-3 bacterium TaxID=2052148 RepID=A0A7C4YIB1_UNCW3
MGGDKRKDKRNRRQIREVDFFMVFRWIMVLLLLLLSIYSSINRSNIHFVLIVTGIYVFINIILRIFFTGIIEKPFSLFFIYLFDIGFVTSVLMIIGEIEQNFLLFYLLTILLVSMTGGIRTSIPATLTSSFIFFYFFNRGNLIDTTYLLKVIFIFLTGIMSGLWKEIMDSKIKMKEEEDEKKMNSIKNFYKNIICSIDEGIVVIDRDGNRIIENGNYKNLIEEEYDEPLVKNLKFMIEMNRPFSTSFMTRDRRFILVKGYPLKNEMNEIEGGVGIVSDITTEKENIDFLNRTKNLANIGKMALYIAHEIRNPLNIIKGMTQLLEMKYGDKEYVEYVLENVKRIDDIIEDLLSFSRKRESIKEEIELSSFIREVALSIKNDPRYEDAKILIGVDEGMRICVDKENLRKILVNLITNGIEAKEEGAKVQIFVTKDEDLVHINVKDNGPGIPEDIRDKIFDPFFTTKKKGTGLGLCIVDKLVQEEGGTIKFYTKKGEGTIFRVSFPLNKERKEVINYERAHSGR